MVEEAGEDTDGMAESVSQLQAKLKALTHGKVNIMADADTFKSTTQILREMSAAWQDMTDIERASALELMGGKRQANILSSLITNFQTVEDVIETASNSQGSAMEENAKWLDSIEGKTTTLKNSMQDLWYDTLNSDTIKFFLDLANAIVKVADSFGLLPTAVGAFAAYKFAATGLKEAFDSTNISAKELRQQVSKYITQQTEAARASETTAAAKIEEAAATEMAKQADMQENISSSTNAAGNLDQANAAQQVTTNKIEEAAALQNAANADRLDGATSYNAAGVGIFSKVAGAATKAGTAIKVLGVALGKAALVMLAVKAATYVLSKAWDVLDKNVIHRAENIKQEVEDLKKTYEEAKKTFDSNLTTLTTSSDTSLYATLEDEFAVLARGVDQYGNNISLTSEQYERYKSICEQIVGIQPSIAAGYDSATKAIGNNVSVLSQLIELQKYQMRQDTEELISDESIGKLVENTRNNYSEASKDKGATTTDENTQLYSVFYKMFSKEMEGRAKAEGRKDRDFNGNYSENDDLIMYILDKLGYQNTSDIAQSYYSGAMKGYDANQFFSDYGNEIKANTEKFGEEYRVTLDDTFYEMKEAILSADEDVKEAENQLINDLYLNVPNGAKAGQYYDQLNDASKKFITEWIKNSDQFKYDTSKTLDENTELAKQNKEVIINMIKDLANADSKIEFEGQQITGQDLLDQYFNFDPSTVNWEDYKAKMNAFVSAISKLTGIDEADVKVALNIDFEEKEQNKQTYIKQIEGHIDLTADQIQSKLDGMNAKQINVFYSIDWNEVDWGNVTSWQDVLDLINKQTQQIETVVSVKTYADLQDSISNYNDILSQTSKIILDNTEVTQDYKDALVELGISEEDLADCFDESNGLVVKNAKALNNLVKSSKSNIAQNVSLAKTQARLQYYELYKKIKTLTGAQGELAKANVQEINALYKEMGTVEQTIAKYSMLEQQLLGAADAYQKYEEAKTADEEKDYGSKASDMISGVIEGLQSAKLGTESFKAAVMGMIPEEVYSNLDTVEAKVAAIANYLKNSDFSKYFTLEFDDNGTLQSAKMTLDNVRAFIETGLSEEKGVFVGQDWQHFELSDDIKTLDDFCNAMKITKEMAFAMFTEIDSYDAEWLNGDFGSIFDKLDLGLEGNIFMATKTLAELDVSLANNEITVDEWAQKYQEANNKLQGCAEDARKNAVEYQTVTEEVSSLKDELDQATKKLNELNQPNSGATEQEIQAQTRQVQVLSTQLGEAIKKKYNLEEPTEMSIQLALDDIESQMSTLEATLASNGIDIKAEIANIDDSELIELGEDGKYKVKPGIDDTNVQSYIDLLNDQSVIDLLVENDEEAKAQIEEVQTAAEAAKKAVEAIPDPSVDSSAAISSINRLINAINKVPTSLTVTTTYREVSEGHAVTKNTPRSRYEMNPTIMADGTAHASGNWGLPHSEHDALTGELGEELVVDPSTGRYYTVGQQGAEFVDLPRGAIIFNHEQTKALLKHGYVTSRGKMLANGTAHAEGNAHVTIVPDYTTKSYYSGASDNNFWTGWTNVSDSLSNAADSLSDATDEFEEVFDWVEIRLQEIDETLDLLNAKLENAVGYSAQNSIIDQILGVSNTKMSNLQAGLQEYANYAAKLLAEIPAQYQAAAQDGSIAITKFAGEADEATVEAINNYREWADKVADLTQRIEELKTEIADLAKQKFDNVSEQYDNIITLIENANEKLEAQVDLVEDRGYVAAKQYYESMIVNTKKQSAELEKEKKALQEVLDQQVKLGNIKVGSDAWYEMVDTLYEVDAAIVECTSSLEEYQNAINDIYWDNFDQLINRIDYLNNETQRLIDLMDSSDMVFKPENENGWTADQVEWTKEGIASLGLYAQQMEIAEYQSKQYAKAIDDLNKDYQAGKYSENEYLEKLDELTSAQYDSIEAYYDAQEAIKDLNQTRIDCIKDGIEKEIDAYQELIDAKKSELQAEKD